MPASKLTAPLCLPRATEKLADPDIFLPATVPKRFSNLEFRCYSQNTEDGVLVALLAAIGTTDRPRVMEICAGVGFESNAANLIIQHGFEGLLFDGAPSNLEQGKQFFARHPNTAGVNEPKWVGGMVSPDNINRLISQAGFSGEIDVFSLDIDGVDYWIWDAIKVVNPRIVVVEVQETWGWDYCLTRPASANTGIINEVVAMGASFRAFIHLADQKGYRLVGCIDKGFNAFFVRNDLGRNVFGDGHYNFLGCLWHWHEDDFYRMIRLRLPFVNKHDWFDPCTNTSYPVHHNYDFPKDIQHILDQFPNYRK